MVKPLADLSSLDLSQHVMSEETLRKALPHDHEFRMIDGICHIDLEESLIVGYKVWDENPWWGAGHIPGRPLMPGVLMLEGCAQVAGVLVHAKEVWSADAFVALAGVNKMRCRRMITPPAKVFFVAKMGSLSSKLARFPAQCICDGQITLNTEIMGAPV